MQTIVYIKIKTKSISVSQGLVLGTGLLGCHCLDFFQNTNWIKYGLYIIKKSKKACCNCDVL